MLVAVELKAPTQKDDRKFTCPESQIGPAHYPFILPVISRAEALLMAVSEANGR